MLIVMQYQKDIIPYHNMCRGILFKLESVGNNCAAAFTVVAKMRSSLS